ncbi:hypothetical protein [Brevibacterium metallidurans]|uniref:Uncharacterized protein n=1 Tax=Brevibacterium metallidurans TaxID=1482676 RepID=A0ABN0SIU8_9MICO
MQMPQFQLPERKSVPPTMEQRARLKRQIFLALKILAIVIAVWLIVTLVASCAQMISNMSASPAPQVQSVLDMLLSGS